MSRTSKLVSDLSIPKFLPLREPDLKTLDQNPIDPCKVPGIEDKDNDGTLFYYDQPLLFAAKIEDILVLVTLIEQDYNNAGMKDGFAVDAKGWDQYLAISISEDLLRKVYNSDIPLRAAYDQDAPKTWFIHKNWCSLRVDGLDRFDPRNWYSVYRIWRDESVIDKWKPTSGTYLNPHKKDV